MRTSLGESIAYVEILSCETGVLGLEQVVQLDEIWNELFGLFAKRQLVTIETPFVTERNLEKNETGHLVVSEWSS